MPNLRVLLADGDTEFRDRLQRALTQQGYSVIPAANGVEARAQLADNHVDVVVTEVALPQSNELELLYSAQAKDLQLPVILLADPSRVSLAERGVHIGARGFMIKPLDDLSALEKMIERAAGGAPVELQATAADPLPDPDEKTSVAEFLQAVSAAEELNQLLSRFAAELARLAHAAHALVLLNSDDSQLHLAAHHGYADRTAAARAYVQSIGEEFAWRVADASELTWRAEPDAPLSRDEQPPVLGLPLRYANHLLGVALAHGGALLPELGPRAREAIEQLSQYTALAIALVRQREQSERLAPHDALTGLLNREHFFQWAEREFRRSWRYSQPIAALVLDIDDFEKLHGLLGASGSDQVLSQVAQLCRLSLRNVDLVGRLETDGFGVVLVMVTREQALLVAERLRRVVSKIEVSTPRSPWQVTVSAGVAIYPRDNCASVHDLFTLAEQATLAAKRAGRNRVVGV